MGLVEDGGALSNAGGSALPSRGSGPPEVWGKDTNIPISGPQAGHTLFEMLASLLGSCSLILLGTLTQTLASGPEIERVEGWEITGCYFNVVKLFFSFSFIEI